MTPTIYISSAFYSDKYEIMAAQIKALRGNLTNRIVKRCMIIVPHSPDIPPSGVLEMTTDYQVSEEPGIETLEFMIYHYAQRVNASAVHTQHPRRRKRCMVVTDRFLDECVKKWRWLGLVEPEVCRTHLRVKFVDPPPSPELEEGTRAVKKRKLNHTEDIYEVVGNVVRRRAKYTELAT